MSITQFTMEEVRCFGGRQTLEIRPLTFLVGENSTGKTTVLACFHVLSDYLRGERIDFNQSPYSMGIFKDIVRNSTKNEKSFKLGFAGRYSFAGKYSNENVEVTVEFVEKKGGIEPTVSSIRVEFVDGEIILEAGQQIAKTVRLASYDEKRNQYQIICGADTLIPPYIKILSLHFKGESDEEIALEEYLSKKIHYIGIDDYRPWDSFGSLSVFSTSPIRSRPKRTYDPTREFEDPEGSDVPMQLMRIEVTQKKEWEKLKQQLIEFGISSGLFQNIKIKNFGQSLGGPFQLQFKVRGPTSNIIDVGYGVSQILPILVQILNHGIRKGTEPEYENMSYFLLQQPEVHLHPRAQAEFSSLLAKLANQGNQAFIIETHSDYMIDRARIEIRKGNIKPEDVSLIYFEPKGNIVNVHNIGFDKMANMTDVPPHYRNFFLKESKRLMGFED